ncbi:hypothetical protein E3N88_30993 [Mikania micrantha]|uniref:TCTP domain-containing protein n=1 Tax=Mikania micrantha TaxID=192012 RepID=A0A5N6MP39_9ASTR|nr:hypothetical protein E3N88_30993 [Mikania micrantha]
MLVYQDLISGDELLSDSFSYKEIENGILWEVEGKWVVQGAVDVDIGANPSAEGADDDEGVDDQAVKVVDIVDTFRLQEQPAFNKKQFVSYIKNYIKNLTPKLDEEKQEFFKKNIEAATKFLLGKLSDLQFFVGESMHDDGSMVFAYYKDGATDPTFLYFGVGSSTIITHGISAPTCARTLLKTPPTVSRIVSNVYTFPITTNKFITANMSTHPTMVAVCRNIFTEFPKTTH